MNARVAQLVEHSTDTRGVPGSNPGARTSEKNLNCFRFFENWARRSDVFVFSSSARERQKPRAGVARFFRQEKYL